MSNKHDANLRKRPVINFQIGLIASLLFTYVMFEVWTTDPNQYAVTPAGDINIEEVYAITDFTIEPDVKPEIVKKSKPKPIPVSVEPVIAKKDEVVTPEKEFKNEEPTIEIPADKTVKIIEKPTKKIDNTTYSVLGVEMAPVYPGCEGLSSNKERIACFSGKISRMISRKFNGDLGTELGLSGKQRIYVQFEIDKNGKVQHIKARGPHKQLEKEAIRVVGYLPKMIPAKQSKTAVKVKYSLPIVFEVLD